MKGLRTTGRMVGSDGEFRNSEIPGGGGDRREDPELRKASRKTTARGDVCWGGVGNLEKGAM